MDVVSGTVQGYYPVAPEAPLNKSILRIGGIITGLIIIGIVIADLVMYFTRKGLFSDFKAKPTDKPNVMYPNGKPDAVTGKPPDVKGVPPPVLETNKSRLTGYLSLNPSGSPGDWGITVPPI